MWLCTMVSADIRMRFLGLPLLALHLGNIVGRTRIEAQRHGVQSSLDSSRAGRTDLPLSSGSLRGHSESN